MNYEAIKPYIELGLVSEQSHPDYPWVHIFNYTQKCQFEQAWNDVTRQCRGLIMNVDSGEIIARPFPKFFNYGEHVSKGWAIPTSRPEVFEKLDGSLGILYEIGGEVGIATRGSFTSDQALWATQWWETNMHNAKPGKDQTHLFEIIYPANRIVVNYNFSGLLHLATIETSSGKTVQVTWSLPVKYPMEIPYTDMESLAKLETPNSEGFVLFYPKEDVRMKIKFAEYVRLHKLVTGLSEIAIWEHLREGDSMDALVEKVPDEFFKWVQQVSRKLLEKFDDINTWAESDYQKALTASKLGDSGLGEEAPEDERKTFALYAKQCKYPGIMFARLDGKDTRPMIWRMIRPHGKGVYKVDIDS